MPILLVVVLTVIAEVVVVVEVAHRVGLLATILVLVVLSASGPFLVRRTGLGVWRRAQDRLGEGEVPGREMMDGVLLLVAGVLITVPGFLGALVGLALLFPPVRGLVRRWASGWLSRRTSVRLLSAGLNRSRAPDGTIPATSRPSPSTTRELETPALDARPSSSRGRDYPGSGPPAAP